MAGQRAAPARKVEAVTTPALSDAGEELRWTRATRIATVALAVMASGFVLHAAAEVVVPVLAAFMVGLMLGPLADRLAKLGLPAVLLAAALAAMVALVFAVASVALSTPLAGWIDKAPQIGVALQEKLLWLLKPLQAAERLQALLKSYFGGGDKAALAVEMQGPPLGQSILAAVSPAIGQVLVFFGSLFFLLIGRERLKRSVVLAFGDRAARLTALRVVSGLQADLGRYFATIAVVNMTMGATLALALWAIGLETPLLWGVLAFLLNFVPFLGPVVMTAVLFLTGMVSFEPLVLSLAPAAAYLVIHNLEAQVITPLLLGKRFEVNPLIIFLSIVFWAWMWGPAGALLAAPILVAATSLWLEIKAAERIPLPD